MKGIAIASLFLLVPACWGGLVPILDITGGGQSTVPLANAVGGWRFHLDNPLTVSALGLWDEGGRPLSIDHQVGLWTTAQDLLVAAIVSNASQPVASASPDGRWLFTPIAPLLLQPGDYILGAVWGNPIIGADPFRFLSFIQTGFGVEFTGSRVATLLPSPTLVFPPESFGGLPGLFGPNLAVDVPEPDTALMLLAGFIACIGFRRVG